MDKQNVLQKEYCCSLQSWKSPTALCFCRTIVVAADHGGVSAPLNSVQHLPRLIAHPFCAKYPCTPYCRFVANESLGGCIGEAQVDSISDLAGRRSAHPGAGPDRPPNSRSTLRPRHFRLRHLAVFSGVQTKFVMAKRVNPWQIFRRAP